MQTIEFKINSTNKFAVRDARFRYPAEVKPCSVFLYIQKQLIIYTLRGSKSHSQA